MTAPPPTDPRERALAAAREVEQLATTGLPIDVFVAQCFQRATAMLRVLGGLLWVLGDDQRLTPLGNVGRTLELITQNPAAGEVHLAWLQKVLTTGQTRFVNRAELHEAGILTEASIVFCGIPGKKRTLGAIELVLPDGLSAGLKAACVQFGEHLCGVISQMVERQRLGVAPQEPGKFWRELEPFLYLLQQSVELNDVAATAASDGRVLLGCDRLSVVVRRGKKTKVQAVSGQKSVNPRANMTQALVALSDQALTTGEPIVFRGGTSGLPPRVEELLSDFVRESAAREVMVVPLFEPEKTPDPHEAEKNRKRKDERRTPLGCLVVEQMGEKALDANMEEKFGVVADHVGAALAHALDRKGILFFPLWYRLGRLKEWFVGRRMAQIGAVAAGIAAATLILTVIPWDYRVEGDGRLMPVIQQRVFAPWDGEVVELKVRAGESVKEGQLLLRLRNDELHQQLVTTRQKWGEKIKEALQLQARISEAARSGTKDDVTRLQGDLEKARVEILGLSEQVKTLESREVQLEVKSPRDGEVATFQLEQTLLHRPVKRGDVLLEVMDETGPWRLEVQVPENRIGHVLRANAEEEARAGHGLPVRFVLATAPEQTFDGRLEEVSTRAASEQETGRVIECFISVDKDALPNHRIGAEVKARIGCGTRSLGYVLFGDVIEFLQRRIWW